MRNVVITAGCRTPIGTMGGQFKDITSLDLSIPVMQQLIKRAGIHPETIDDVIWGCNYQRTYKENNLARVAALKAGLPSSVPGITIHRNCTSSMSAVQLGFYQIKAGEADCIMAGGADSMSTAPHMVFNARYGQKYGHMELRDSMWDSLTNLGAGPAMGMTAENVADEYHVTRDEYPRRDVTLESLSNLKAAFQEGGRVTAGNASGMNDAAAGILLMEEEKAKEAGAPIMARIQSVATTGVEPELMGIGPISASQKALAKAGLTIDDIDLFEINEAFAAQCIACQKTLGIPEEKLNVNGSGISLGHPVGATGARLVVTLIHELAKRKQRYGLATLCAGGGMGTAIIVEMV